MKKTKFRNSFLFLFCLFCYTTNAQQTQTNVDIDSAQLKLVLKTAAGKKLSNSLLESYDGSMVNSEDFFKKSKITYTYIWASWCEECIENIPKIIEKVKQYPLPEVQLCFISIDADRKNWRNWSKKWNIEAYSYLLPNKDTSIIHLTLQEIVLSNKPAIVTGVPILSKMDNQSIIFARNLLYNAKVDSMALYWFHIIPPVPKVAIKNNYNTYLDSCLLAVYACDQGIRNYWDYLQKTPSTKPEELLNAKKQWHEIDSINLEIVERLIGKNKGWIHRDSISSTASNGLFLAIHHYPNLSIKQKHLPLIQQSVKEGWGNKSNLALLEDRIQVGLNKKQLYGTQIFTKKNGEKTLYPIKNKRNLNKRRKKMGLLPIEEYCRSQNVRYGV